MIRGEFLPELERLAGPGGRCFRGSVLMLGAQESVVSGYPTSRSLFARWTKDYVELDLADGDLKLDLNLDLKKISANYMTVCNIGTLEHCWNIHNAYCNALRAVEEGGWFMTHSPVGGWATNGLLDHGVHMTEHGSIKTFVARNGFVIEDSWTTRWKERGTILWLRAQKVRHVAELADFALPYQVRGYEPAYRAEP